MTERRFLCRSSSGLRAAAAEVARMAATEKNPIEVVVRRPRQEKSVNQRRLFHAICADMAAACGDTPGSMKGLIKQEFYGADPVKLPDGSRFTVIRSTEEEDREGYGRLIDFAYQFAAEHGVVIPDRRGR